MADSWEDLDVPIVAPPKANWDDEDVDEDEIKESWEDSDEDEKPAPVVPPVHKRVPLAKRIAERERQERENAEKRAAAVEEDEEEDEEDIVSRRRRQDALEKAADLENATDMFRGVSIQDQELAKKIASANPRSKEEFEEFRKVLMERIETFKTQRAYPAFIESLTTELSRSLKDVEVRKIASALTRIANEKQREAKEKHKKKTSKRPAVQVSNVLDTTNYDDYGDYDDFM